MARPFKVLVVDDEPEIVQYVEHVLRRLGHEAIGAGNGEEAVQKALKDPPDLIILDVMMPIIDGFTVCRRLRRDPATSRARIVMLSANTVRSSNEWEDAGADAYLPKPFGALALMDAVLGRPVRA